RFQANAELPRGGTGLFDHAGMRPGACRPHRLFGWPRPITTAGRGRGIVSPVPAAGMRPSSGGPLHLDVAAVRLKRQGYLKAGSRQSTVDQFELAAKPFPDPVADIQPQAKTNARPRVGGSSCAHELVENAFPVGLGNAAAIVRDFDHIFILLQT